jgi:hypothetical protein
VAVRSFQLNGHPYLLSLRDDNRAVISRINDDGRGWTDVYEEKWPSNFVGTAITTFELNGHPYVFALSKGDEGWITRINDDGKGWEHIYHNSRSHKYVAVRSFQLNGHPYLFGLKETDKALISRINDDGRGWEDIHEGKWSSQFVGTAIDTFELNGHPYIFAQWKALVTGRLIPDVAYITRLHEPKTISMDLSDHYPLQVKFKVVRGDSSAADVKVALKSDSGLYAARCNNCIPKEAYPDNVAVHVKDPGKAFAQWYSQKLDNGNYAFKSVDSGKYMARCNNCIPGVAYPDNVFVHATDPEKEAWAQWEIITLP